MKKPNQRFIHILSRLVAMIVFCIAVSLLLSTTTFGSPATGTKLLHGWTLTAPLPDPLADAQTVFFKNALYTISGRGTLNASDKVVSASLEKDGYITAWHEIEVTNPISRYLHTVVNLDDKIYTFGGYNDLQRFSSVYRWEQKATPQPPQQGDDSFHWMPENDLPLKLLLHSTTILDNCVYVIGGVNENNTPLSSVYRAAINGSTLSFWARDRDLPQARFRASAVAYKDLANDSNRYIFLLGGFDGKDASDLIYFSKVNSDCSLGEWKDANRALPHALYYHASVVFRNNLFIIGGRRNAQEDLPYVFSTQISGNGELAEWLQEDNLPLSLHRHGAVLAFPDGCSAYLYVVGGKHGDVYQSQVYRTQLTRCYYLPIVQKD